MYERIFLIVSKMWSDRNDLLWATAHHGYRLARSLRRQYGQRLALRHSRALLPRWYVPLSRLRPGYEFGLFISKSGRTSTPSTLCSIRAPVHSLEAKVLLVSVRPTVRRFSRLALRWLLHGTAISGKCKRR